MTPYQKAATPIAHVSPAAIWEQVAAAGRQFLLLGDSHHGNTDIARVLAVALPILRAGGFRHLGTENDIADHQKAYDRYQDASVRSRRSGGDERRLLRHLGQWINPYTADREDDVADDVSAMFGLLSTARQQGVRVHCLNSVPDFETFHAQRGVKDIAKYAGLLEQAVISSDYPKTATRADVRRLIELEGEFLDYDRGLGPERAQRLMSRAGSERAMVLFGSNNFRYSKTVGIEKSLPPGSTAYVLIGARPVVEANMRYDFRVHRGSLPDFVVTTESHEGWVLPPARKNGLWPG